MNHNLRLSLCTLMIITLGTAACFAVTVPDSTGQSPLPLNQIPDIIRHVTARSSGDLSMEKESLVIVAASFNAANPASYTLNTEFFDFTTDGVVFNGSLNYSPAASDKYVSNADYKSSTFPVDLAVSVPSQDRVIFIDSLQENSQRDATALSLIAKGGYESLDVNENIIPISEGRNGRLLHVNNGVLAGLQVMSAKGLNGDVIAEVVRNNENIAVLQFLLSGDLDPDEPSHKYFSASRTYNTSIRCPLDETPKMLDGSMYFPISVTAGDFDYDGCDNELAVVWSDISAVHVKVFSLTYTAARMSARTMAVDTIYESSFTYNYPASSWQTRSIKSHGTNMDGFSTVYSCCIVKGDFDADGKEEFAVIFKDVNPKYAEFNGVHFSGSLFSGITGKIHVVTHKWDGDGNTFKTQEKVQAFDMYYTTGDSYNTYHDQNIPIGVKAAAGDFNGDGRVEAI